MAFIAKVFGGVKASGGKFVALFQPGKGGFLGILVRGLVVLLCLAAVMVGLWWINARFALERFLQPPLPILGRVWLPLLFALTLGAAWSGWRLWSTLVADPGAPRFPDVGQAWDFAMAELSRIGMDLREKPLFLILGTTSGSSERLMEASGLAMRLRGVPDDPDSPIRLHACDAGIFVACEGVSLLSRSGEVSPDDAESAGSGTENPSFEPAEDRRGGTAGAITGTASRTRRRITPSTLLDRSREVEQTTARLRLLCRLIARDRRPYCPVNGILVAVPFGQTLSDMNSDSIAASCQQDLDTIESVLQVACPVLAVFTDLDRQPGYHEVVAGLPSATAEESIGVNLPPIPDLRDEDVGGMIEGAVRWLAFHRLPALIYPRWQFGPDPGPEPANAGLYGLLRAVQEAHGRLSRILVRGIYRGPRRLLKLAGVYLAGTGSGQADRAFGSAAFGRAVELQDHVSWGPAMIARDRLLKLRAGFGYLAIAAWSSCLVAAIFWIIARFRERSW